MVNPSRFHNVVVGLDFDNTIVSYDSVLNKYAFELGYIQNKNCSKAYIRNAIRQLHNGEMKWQHLQAIIYGEKINYAVLFDGVDSFFRSCKRNHLEVYIVSHKTEFSSLPRCKINLRKPAMEWLRNHCFFENDGFGLRKNQVFFESTRHQKIQRIKQLGCTHFIDDLIETFQDHRFPPNVKKILFSPKDRNHHDGLITAQSWKEINRLFFDG